MSCVIVRDEALRRDACQRGVTRVIRRRCLCSLRSKLRRHLLLVYGIWPAFTIQPIHPRPRPSVVSLKNAFGPDSSLYVYVLDSRPSRQSPRRVCWGYKTKSDDEFLRQSPQTLHLHPRLVKHAISELLHLIEMNHSKPLTVELAFRNVRS